MYRYVKSSDMNVISAINYRYPKYIYYQESNSTKYGRTVYKYRQKYLHAEEPKHDYMEGMYYEVFEIMKKSYDDGFEPISEDDRYYMFGISELDVYPDGFVGYIWNGRLNKLGKLVGDKVVKD